MRPLKLSTEKTVRIGPYVDKTDGVTSEAGLAGAGTEISKAGGAFGTGPTLGTYDSDGWYPITLTTSHTDTIGELVVKGVDDATHLPVWETFTVLPAVVFDALFATAATDYLQVDVVQIAGAAVSTSSAQLGVNVVNAAGTAWGSGAITANSLADECITNAKLASAAVTAATFGVGAITANSIDTGAITSAKFAAGAINAAAIATGAIDADALAADAVDEIWNKALTELSAVPGVTASVLSALNWIFTVARNKVEQTATTSTLRKDDGTTSLATSTVSDDGTTFTRGEWS